MYYSGSQGMAAKGKSIRKRGYPCPCQKADLKRISRCDGILRKSFMVIPKRRVSENTRASPGLGAETKTAQDLRSLKPVL
jgi:hypothetical protein